MNATLKNVLAVIAGIIIGGMVNMAIITISGSVAPLPEGVDPNDLESIKSNIHRYSIGNLLLPIIAHALGVIGGAIVTVKIAATNQKALALTIGGFFLLGGIYMVYLLPEAPLWMKATDILVAYIPMGWLGWKLAGGKK